MALVNQTGTVSYSAAKYGFTQACEAGEALTRGFACVIKSDGKAYHAGTSVQTGTMQVGFDGFVVQDYVSGDAVTLFGQGSLIMIDGDASLNEGTDLYLSATAGRVGDAKVAGVDLPVARVVTTSTIRVLR